ncbi:MAG: hypothetical protein HZA52_10280 [Planctomycetes bacterium]|nr:hypothetical protein [Planctomycetota bacterium]
MTRERSTRRIIGGLAYAWPAIVVALGIAGDRWRWNHDGRHASWVIALGASAVVLPALALAWFAVLTPRSRQQRVLRVVIVWASFGLELGLLALVLMASAGGV